MVIVASFDELLVICIHKDFPQSNFSSYGTFLSNKMIATMYNNRDHEIDIITY